MPLPSRRRVLTGAAIGLGGVALTDLLARTLRRTMERVPHHEPKARRLIYIFLEGGLSQIDSYDHKPALQPNHGKPLPDSIRPPKFTFAPQGTVIGSPFAWRQWGQSGAWASDLFPEVNSRFIDDLCFIHSLHHQSNDHESAKTVLHTGVPREIRPTLGSWLLYGLGSENENLPGYIDIVPGAPKSRSTGFLPANFGATPIGRPNRKKTGHLWENLGSAFGGQERHLDFIRALDGESQAKVANLELAFRMQTEAPELMDLSRESQATRDLYGIGGDHTDEFGRALLLARRFCEAGVRYITVTHATPRYGNLWDQHSNLQTGHRGNAHAVDRPIAALLRDLDARGLLQDTLVMCGSEFGRTPTFEYFTGIDGKHTNGRDHNPHGFTMWFAGGAVKRGHHHGATDDFGYFAVKDPVSIHDLHATILHIMGFDHEKLTFLHGGRDFRLTDVYGKVVRPILA